MKAITLRNLPDKVADAVQAKADAEHLSINKAIVRLLEEKLGLNAKSTKKKIHHDLDRFIGSWTKAEGDEFMQTLERMRAEDREMEK